MTPWWLKSLQQHGPTAVLLGFMLYWLTQVFGVVLADHVKETREYQQASRTYLWAICLNSAQDAEARARCPSPDQPLHGRP